jgi:hypothetical protein
MPLSRGGPQADFAPERVEVGGDALIQAVETVTLFFSECGVGRDRPKQTGGQGRVDALEEFEEEDAQAITVG